MEDNQFDAESAVSDYLTGNNVTAARAGVAFSAEANPDYEAHIKAVAQRNGVPIDTVREHPEEMKVQDKLGAINFDELATKNPVTTSTLGDFDKAKIVHDDIDNLSTMETALQFGKNAASTLAAGAYAGTAGALGAVEAVMKNAGDLVDPLIPEGYNPLYKQAEALQDLRHNQEAWRDYYKPGAETILGKGLVSGGMSLAQNIPLLAAAIYTRNPSLVLPTMTTQSFGQSYGEDVDKGMSTPAATIHAGANAAIEYGTEAWGINKLFGDLNAGSSILKTMMHQIVPEVVGEQAATALQGLNDWLVQHPEKPVKEYLSTMPAAAAETLVATMVGMGGNTALLKTVEGVQKVSNIDFRKAKKSENTALNIEQLNKVVAASKVLQRDPTIIHDFATEVSENGPVQNLYINAETLMQSGVAQKLSELLPSITEENIAEALATGGEIKIPVADYVTHIAGTDLAPELVDHLRVEGEDYTRAEAKDYMTNHASEMQAHVERVMAENQVTDEFKASADRVKASVLEQLNSLGRFSKTKNEFDATLYTAYVTTRAKQLGITPEEMYEKHKVTFAAEGMGGQQYDQSKKTIEEVTTRWQKSLSRIKDENFEPNFDTPLALKHMGVAEKALSFPPKVMKQVLSKHRDLPTGVIANLPALLSDPLFIFPHKDGGISVAIDAKTIKGEPLLVGVREGRIRTITPLHHAETVNGTDRLNNQFRISLHAGEKVYARNENALTEAKAFDLALVGDNYQGRYNKSKKRITTNDDLVNQYGNSFYQSSKVTKQKPEPKNAITGNLDKVNPAAKEAVFEYLSRRPTEEQDRIKANLNDHVGTAWAAAAVKGMAYREMLHRAMEGRNIDNLTTNEMWGGQDMANTKIIKAFKLFPKKGDVAITSLISQYDFVGGNRKAENDVSTSFANCNPSNECATHCYAAGSNARPNEIAKSEFTEFVLENYLKETSDRIAKIYSNTDAGEAGLSLRLNDKGDLSDAQINLINNLNDKGIALQIFSKRPDLLRKIPDVNLKMLSIDSSNMEIANANPDLRLAVVITDGMTESMLEPLHDRVSVYLPVNLKGKAVSTEELKARFPSLYSKMKRDNLCPVDGGGMATLPGTSFVDIKNGINKNTEEKVWTCTACDLYGAAGCFKGDRQTTQRNAAEQMQNISLSDVKKEIAIKNARIELQKQLDLLQKLGDIDGKQHETVSRTLLKGSADIRLDVDGRAEKSVTDKASSVFSREPESRGRTGQDDSGSRSGGESGSGSQIFNQGQINSRGSFDPSTNTITALKDADLSTMLHEMGHYFFEADIALASELSSLPFISKGEQTIIDDVSALFTWHGLQGDIHDQLNQWHSMSFEEKRSYHEKTAESFEHYLLTGKAPSLELQRSFQTFRSWLLGVYRSIKDFIKAHPQAGTLSPEVRAVFDRMLASEEQIKLAEQGRSMMPLFESAEQAGMTEQEFAEYQQLGEDATNAAIDVLSSKATGDMQWLSNARAKSLKKMQRQHDELRRNVRSEVRSKVMSQPVYQAWSFLTRKLSKDDKINPQERPKSNPNYVDESQDTLFVAIAKLGGLRRDDIESEWGLDPATRSPMPVFGKHVLRRKGGMAIDDMGQRLMEHGYLTPDEHGKFWQGEFEEKFNNELRGQLEYSTGFHSDVFAEEGKAGQQIANPWALSAGRIELSALKGMMLPEEMEQRIIDLKMTAKNGLDADVVSDIIPGFSSGDELIRAIAGAENPRELVERMTDQTMLERHSELATPEAIQKAADEAIHNDVRARFITREANALAQATGGTKLLASAARDYATSIIGRLKIRNIKPHQYTLAETRAAKLSEKASKDGDLKKAAAEKRNQAINLYAAKAAYDALDEVDKILRYFKKFNGDNKKVDIEYLDQIRGLLAKFDLRKQSGAQIDETVRLRSWVQSRLAEGELPIVAETLLNTDERKAYVAQIESRDEHGELVYADDEERLKLLADAIDRSATRSYKEATFEELQGLNDTIKQIEHIGRLKNKLLTAQDKRNFEAIRDEITDSIMEHGGLGNKNTRTPNDILGKALVGIKSFGADHIKVATWARIMDGGLDNGPVWRFLIKPANERATQETSMRAKATAELDAILRPILKKASYYDKSLKGKFFASIGDSLLWQERFTILLNMGNESNLQRLMAGGISGKVGQLTMSQILDVVNTMSPEEINAAQAVWDHFESYRPKIAEKELRVSGVEPKWIPIRAIDIKANDGSIVHLRGGYYPVKFDSRVNIRAEAHASAQEAKDLMKASYSAATTNRSFTKERVEEVHGRPLLLNMTGLYSGVNDVIHDLAWHEWVIDANKMLRSSKIDEAIRAFYGPEVKKQFDTWRNDIVVGQRRLDHGIEKAAGIARQFVSGSALTFNLLSAAMQPLGLSNSIARIGAEWIGKGVACYTANPIQATIEAQAKSEWMANRTRTRFRELNELRNQVQGQTAAKEIMGRYGYWLMMKSQMTVDVPTWWGGYEKGIAEGHDEATAIALADQGVKDSQGGGEEVDQSGIERGNALVKLFTAFYGFMGTTLNTAVGSTITEKSKAKIAANLLLTLMVPAVFGSLLKDALTPDGGDDDEGLAEKLMREQISFLMGMIAFGREFAQMANPKSTGYSGPTGLRVIPDIYHLGEQIKQGEFDDAFRKQFINVLGDFTGIPAVQVNRTITGTKALVEGKTDNPMAIGFGFKNK